MAGRPAFKPTKTHRTKVEQLISCGMSQDDCARALGISTPTLVKSFPDEIAIGAAKKRAEIIGMLYKQAKKGNATCIKKLEEMSRVAVAADAVNSRCGSEPAPAKEPKVGKKEQRQQAAAQVGGIFTPPAPPKLIVNNGT